MPRNQEQRVIAVVQKVLKQFSEWGLVAGFVYTTTQGLIKVLGSDVVVDLVSKHQTEMEGHPVFLQQFNNTEEQGEDVQDVQVTL